MNSRVLIFKQNWQTIIALPVLFLLVYLYPIIPWVTTHTLCAVKIITGLDCPACGITRSFSAILHGDFERSFYYHPFGFLLAFGLLYLFIRNLTELVLGVEFGPLLSYNGKKLIGFVFLFFLITTWIIRICYGV